MSKKSQTSNIYSNIFGNTPEKEHSQRSKGDEKLRNIERIKIKKSIHNLFMMNKKDKSDNSNSSLPDYNNVEQIRRSLKDFTLHKNSQKEQKSDSIILDIQRENNKNFHSKTVKVEQKLKVILNQPNPKGKSTYNFHY